MKLVIFKETGEIRNVHEGEWYQTGFQGYLKWNHVNECIFAPIYERIEIPIPSWASRMTTRFWGEHQENCEGTTVEISRPKVKKWVWERDYDNSHTSNMKVVTKIPFSEKEIWGDGNRWRRVPGTEIEVEEY